MNLNLILRRLPHIVWLLVVWVALWGDVSVANIISGSIVVAVLAWFFTDVGPRPASPVRIFHVVELIGWFTKALALSTWQVARLTLSSAPINPAIISFPMHDVSDAVATLVADMISLTPGTLTLDIRSDGVNSILYVHVLDLDDEAAVREDLRTLRRLAVLAFGGSAARADVEEAT